MIGGGGGGGAGAGGGKGAGEGKLGRTGGCWDRGTVGASER